jgi:hypothetical protein
VFGVGPAGEVVPADVSSSNVELAGAPLARGSEEVMSADLAPANASRSVVAANRRSVGAPLVVLRLGRVGLADAELGGTGLPVCGPVAVEPPGTGLPGCGPAAVEPPGTGLPGCGPAAVEPIATRVPDARRVVRFRVRVGLGDVARVSAGRSVVPANGRSIGAALLAEAPAGVAFVADALLADVGPTHRSLAGGDLVGVRVGDATPRDSDSVCTGESFWRG